MSAFRSLILNRPEGRAPRAGVLRRCALSLLALLGAGSAAACNPVYYAPSSQAPLLLTEGGQIAGGVVANADRVEGTLAYGITDAWGLHLAGGLITPEELSNRNTGEGRYLDIGARWSPSPDFGTVWEIQGLVGLASFENRLPGSPDLDEGSVGELDARIRRIGIQPAIGFRHPHFEAIGSTRLMRIHYSEIEGDLWLNGVDQRQRLGDRPGYTLLEPAITLRAGWERVKFQLQSGFSYNLTEPGFPQDDSMMTLGVIFRLPTRGSR